MNAPHPVLLQTPDGSGQCVHPDVIETPGGWAGYRYWMAMTPFPHGEPRVENPCVRASANGVDWVLPQGTPDPIAAAPADGYSHHADTDLAFDGQRLHLVYMTRNPRTETNQFSWTHSLDARSWSAPQVLLTEPWAVSPALLATPDLWSLWYVRYDVSRGPGRDNPSQLFRLQGPGPQQLAQRQACTLEIPGHIAWHIDVIAVPGGFEALVAAFPLGTQPARCRLFHTRSDDGLRFELSQRQPLLQPNRRGWDSCMIYRSTFLREADGQYRVWYTGASWAMRCGIGQLRGPLDDLRPVADTPALMPSRRARLAEDLRAVVVNTLQRTLPKAAYAALQRRLGRRQLTV